VQSHACLLHIYKVTEKTSQKKQFIGNKISMGAVINL
jgi:hypothetical protein